MFYNNKVKRKLLHALHATNLEFIERAVLVEDFLKRRKTRVVLYLLKAFVKFNAGKFKSISPSQTYYIWRWMSAVNAQLDFKSLKFECRLSRKYIL